MGRSGMVHYNAAGSLKRRRRSRRVKHRASFGYAADVETDCAGRNSRSDNSDDSDKIDWTRMNSIHESSTVKAAGFFEDVSRHHKKRVKRMKRLASLENFRRNMRWKVNGQSDFSDSTASVTETVHMPDTVNNNPPSIMGGVYSSEYATSAIEAITNQCGSLYGRSAIFAVAPRPLTYGTGVSVDATTVIPISDGDQHVDLPKPSSANITLPILSPRLEDGLGIHVNATNNAASVAAAAATTTTGCCCDSRTQCHWCSSSLSLLLESMSCGQTASSGNSSAELEGCSTAAGATTCESYVLGGDSMTYEQALALSREPRMLIEASAPHRIVHANRALHDTLREEFQNVSQSDPSTSAAAAAGGGNRLCSIGERSATPVIGRPMTDLVQLVPSSTQCTSSSPETNKSEPPSAPGSLALCSPTIRNVSVLFPPQMKSGRDGGTVTADCSGSEAPAAFRRGKEGETTRNMLSGFNIGEEEEMGRKRGLSKCGKGFCVCIHPVASTSSDVISMGTMECCRQDATHFLLELRSAVNGFSNEQNHGQRNFALSKGGAECEKPMFAIG